MNPYQETFRSIVAQVLTVDFFQAWFARNACRRVFMERAIVTVELEHFPNADVLIAQDCSIV